MTRRSQAQRKRSSPRPRARRAGRPGAARWLLLPVGLGVAAAAIWLLLASGPIGVHSEPVVSSEPSHADISEASRAQLREILREADRGEPAGEPR